MSLLLTIPHCPRTQLLQTHRHCQMIFLCRSSEVMHPIGVCFGGMGDKTLASCLASQFISTRGEKDAMRIEFSMLVCIHSPYPKISPSSSLKSSGAREQCFKVCPIHPQKKQRCRKYSYLTAPHVSPCIGAKNLDPLSQSLLYVILALDIKIWSPFIISPLTNLYIQAFTKPSSQLSPYFLRITLCWQSSNLDPEWNLIEFLIQL